MSSSAKIAHDENDLLLYDGCSITFFQIFTLEKECAGVDAATLETYKDYIREKPSEMCIDSQIFEYNGMESPINKYDLRGFALKIALAEDDEENNHFVEGEVFVEASVFHERIVSITYKFIFSKLYMQLPILEGETKRLLKTDDIILLLSLFLSVENWTERDSSAKERRDNFQEARQDWWLKVVNYGHIESEIHSLDVVSFYLDESGRWGNQKIFSDKIFDNAGEIFDNILDRYKKAAVGLLGVPADGNLEDSRYAYVDIWESLQHAGEMNETFDKWRKDKDAEPFIEHIVGGHKKELVGLMTMYPDEWTYRDSEKRDFNEVCGKDIAIDTDDLVLANDKICLTIGTYNLRTEKWGAHILGVREGFGVSWPEHLLILEMLLVKRHTIKYIRERLIESVLEKDAADNPTDALEVNEKLHIEIMYLMTKLDAVRYMKIVAHKIMHDRTSERLGVREEEAELEETINRINVSLNTIKDVQTIKESGLMNTLLFVLSIASLFQVLLWEITNDNGSVLRNLMENGIGADSLNIESLIVLIAVVIFFLSLLFLCRRPIKWVVKHLRKLDSRHANRR